MAGLRGYDAWKTRSPDDEYAMDHPEKYRRGKYVVYVERTVTAQIRIEVDASSESDAIDDAIVEAKSIPLAQWVVDQDDYEAGEILGPPERDPDDARDERMDQDYDR
jgi:hypothetical protein